MHMTKNKPYFLQLTETEQKAALEALIFSSAEAVSPEKLFQTLMNYDSIVKQDFTSANGIDDEISDIPVISEFDFTLDSIRRIVAEINQELKDTNRPFVIVDYGSGYQFATRQEYGQLVSKLDRNKSKRRLSQAALETLAIIAYKQPVSKPEVEQIRGVNSNEVVNTLIDRGFVEIIGRSDALGRPLLFGTSPEFLRVFGLKSLDELPNLREIEDIANTENIHLKPKSTYTISIDPKFPERTEFIKNGNHIENLTEDNAINKALEDSSNNDEIEIE